MAHTPHTLNHKPYKPTAGLLLLLVQPDHLPTFLAEPQRYPKALNLINPIGKRTMAGTLIARDLKVGIGFRVNSLGFRAHG